MKKIFYPLGALMLLSSVYTGVYAQSYSENFDDITTLPGSGWVQQNNSSPVGTNPVWFQGNNVANGGPFDAYNGAVNAYVACNFNSTSGGTGTISNWLVTPNRTLRNGDVFQFYTRKAGGGTDYPDRLEVRMSTNGASTNVGTGATATGDFTTLLLSINPTLVTNVYPQTWTQYTITISGLPAPTSGRIAFRYYVTNGGPTGSNSDYIGVDNVVYTQYTCPTFTLTPSGGSLTAGTAGTAYSQSFSQTGALGVPNYAVTAGALPPGLTLSASGTISGTPTATGTFNFTTTVSDNSGCSGSGAYSITIVCPTNGATLSLPTAACSNDSPITLTGGSPAGGTYSGTGVSGGVFDPASGTQTITYDITDPYGCAQSASATYTVNTAPAVSLGAFGPVCDNAGLVTLNGGSPAGGVFGGTGVTGSDFDPASGTQTITYTYTDGNGCSNSANQTLTVNTAPIVTLAALTAVCDNVGTVSLSGNESPAGGVFGGTGVTGSDFDPASGTQTITYTYTDGNGCSNSDNQTLTVNTAPTVTLTAFAAVCDNAGTVTLSGGTPAGGTFSGAGVTGSNFDPTSGSQIIAYSYTDGNGCSNSDNQTLTVNTAPTVSLTALAPVCDNAGTVTLSGGTPAGGTFSGTGVTGTDFDPTSGTQTITYSYTDGNGCSNSDNQTLTVNTAPTVTLAALASVCDNAGTVTLSGGAPAGGTFSGTGVTGGDFDPTSGTQTITYSYTDGNGCSNSANQLQTVDTCTGITSIGANVFTCYPNPASTQVTISVTQTSGAVLSIRILDVVGNVVATDSYSNYIGAYQKVFDLSTFAQGVYLVELHNGNNLYTQKIMKQ